MPFDRLIAEPRFEAVCRSRSTQWYCSKACPSCDDDVVALKLSVDAAGDVVGGLWRGRHKARPLLYTARKDGETRNAFVFLYSAHMLLGSVWPIFPFLWPACSVSRLTGEGLGWK